MLTMIAMLGNKRSITYQEHIWLLMQKQSVECLQDLQYKLSKLICKSQLFIKTTGVCNESKCQSEYYLWHSCLEDEICECGSC
jgi:hypothetical protein